MWHADLKSNNSSVLSHTLGMCQPWQAMPGITEPPSLPGLVVQPRVERTLGEELRRKHHETRVSGWSLEDSGHG